MNAPVSQLIGVVGLIVLAGVLASCASDAACGEKSYGERRPPDVPVVDWPITQQKAIDIAHEQMRRRRPQVFAKIATAQSTALQVHGDDAEFWWVSFRPRPNARVGFNELPCLCIAPDGGWIEFQRIGMNPPLGTNRIDLK